MITQAALTPMLSIEFNIVFQFALNSHSQKLPSGIELPKVPKSPNWEIKTQSVNIFYVYLFKLNILKRPKQRYPHLQVWQIQGTFKCHAMSLII